MLSKNTNNFIILDVIVKVAIIFLAFSIFLTLYLLFAKLYNNNYASLDLGTVGSYFGGMLGPPFSFFGIVMIVKQYKKQVEDSQAAAILALDTKLINDKRMKVEFNINRIDNLISRITDFESNLQFNGWIKNQSTPLDKYKSKGRGVFNDLSKYTDRADKLRKIANTNTKSLLYEEALTKGGYTLGYENADFYDIYSFLSQLIIFREFILSCYNENNKEDSSHYEKEFDFFTRKYITNILAILNFCDFILKYHLLSTDKAINTHFVQMHDLAKMMLEQFTSDLNYFVKEF